MSRTDVMSDPIGDPPLKSVSLPPPIVPLPSLSAEDAFDPLAASIEPTDDSPTVISKMPQSPSKTDDNFSGSLRGRRLAHFELLEPIGIGGMAAVLRARDTQLDRVVALKILPPEMANDSENIHRFHQEARSAAKLDHENIARVFFCGEDQRLHFIAFEFVEGDNLRTILERRGRLPVGEALHYMVQVAAGLAHASQRGVVHRDIKPSNIIVTPNGRAKLVDMGLARSLEPQHDMGLTHSGVTLGTFDYISPEQALEPREADVRSDIYSLGCTFYHMLTGHPPVPEGTAAKKLHHHQHVKPTDPRQFVPDLPDEVAVILDRMMAKQAKDRYQTPEQLVHHLYLTARKLGGGDEVPEGVLGLEAAMPEPPASRSLALAILAAVAVVGLIFFLDRASPSKPEPISVVSTDIKSDSKMQERPAPPVSPPLEGGSTKVAKPSPVKQTIPIFNLDRPTATNLAEFLRNNKSAEEIIVELDDLDLRARDDREPDLVIANPTVTIRPLDPKKRPTIRYDYRARVSQALQVALTIESKNCTVRGLRFVLDQTGAELPMASLLFRGPSAAKYRIHDCEFIQGNPFGNKDKRMTSVLAESRGRASLELNESCFLGFASLKKTLGGAEMVFDGAASGGQDAVTRRGPVRIEAVNCVFGPHAATFRLEGSAPDEDGLVRLNHCSVLTANQSAVFDLTEGADAHIAAEFSLFSHPGDPGLAGMADGKGAVLLRRAARLGQVDYKGRDNRYHQLDSYLVVADVSDDAQFDQMKKDDNDSRELAVSPWKDPQPLAQLEKLSIQAAFAVNPLVPELRVKKSANGQLIGVEKALAFSYLDNLPTLKIEPPAQAGSRALVVDNSVKADLEKLLYPSLRQALSDARPGDVIFLRVNGEMPLDPSSLSGDNLVDLTIRADMGYRPILTLSGGTEEVDAALFRVGNGKLRLEDVEIRLQPSRDAYDSQAVVSFMGDGDCVLKNCLITLDRSARKTALAVAVLAEPGKLMKKVEETRGPRFVLENCFVRGQGDLVWSRAGQPADVTVKNSLVALTGSLLNVEGVKDMPAPAGSLALQLSKCTTYLGGNLIRLRAAKDLKSLATIRCKSDGCLFLPISGDRVLIHLEAPESEHGLKDKIAWESEDRSTNAYGNFNTLLEQQATGLMMKMAQPSTLADWKTFSRETDSLYSAKLLNPPSADIAFTQLLPAAFRPGESWKDYGVEVASLRPLLPREKPELRTPKTDIPDTGSD